MLGRPRDRWTFRLVFAWRCCVSDDHRRSAVRGRKYAGHHDEAGDGDTGPIAERRADVPAHLEQIVMRLLEKDPANRFANGAALIAALDGAPMTPTTPASAISRDRDATTGRRPLDLDI